MDEEEALGQQWMQTGIRMPAISRSTCRQRTTQKERERECVCVSREGSPHKVRAGVVGESGKYPVVATQPVDDFS